MTKTLNSGNPMETQPIGKLLFTYAFPSCISMIVNALYNIVDQIFIGRGVGFLGNGATNVIFPLTVVAVAFGLLVGDGGAAFFSIHLGRGEKEKASNSIGNVVTVSFILGILLCIIISVFLKPLCIACAATENILPYAMDYGRIIALGMPIVVFECAFASVIRADGSPKFSMAGLIAGCITNIVLDYLFVMRLDMGVSGAALATIIGQYVNGVIFIFYLNRFKQATLKKEFFKLKSALLKQVCGLGMSSFVTQMAIVIVVLVTNRLLVVYGASSVYGEDIPMSAMGVTMKINNILVGILSGIAAGCLPIVGFNYGAGKIDRVKKTLKLAVGTAMIVGAVATVIFQVFPTQIVGIFGSESELYTEFAVKTLRIFMMLCILDGLNNILPTFLQAVEKPKYSTISSSCRQIIFQIPAAFIAAAIFGVVGVLFCGPITCAASFILNLFLVRKSFKELDQIAK